MIPGVFGFLSWLSSAGSQFPSHLIFSTHSSTWTGGCPGGLHIGCGDPEVVPEVVPEGVPEEVPDKVSKGVSEDVSVSVTVLLSAAIPFKKFCISVSFS